MTVADVESVAETCTEPVVDADKKISEQAHSRSLHRCNSVFRFLASGLSSSGSCGSQTTEVGNWNGGVLCAKHACVMCME